MKTVASWVDGEWRMQEQKFDAHRPDSGEIYQLVDAATGADVDRAVRSARSAYQQHGGSSPRERANWCISAAEVVESAAEDLGKILSMDQGKPIAEATAEVLFAAQGFRTAAEVVATYPQVGVNTHDSKKRVYARREGIGVWAVITPWNFPVNIPVEYLAFSLAGGNGAVWKPAPTTSVVAHAFREVLLKADFPQNLIQLILTEDIEVASHLTHHPLVSGIGFTGGSVTGQAIARAAWNKKQLLELGGNTQVVVLDDACLDSAATSILNSAYFNAGQVCSAAGKILCSDAIAAEMRDRLVAGASSIKVGKSLDEGTEMGPVHLRQSLPRLERLVRDAVSGGAEVALGGGAMSGDGGFFFEPTVISNVPRSADIFREETFGPIASITSFGSEQDLLNSIAGDKYGLVGSLYTRDLSAAFKIGEAMDCGLVMVNESSNYWEHGIAFGGASGKESGRGRLGGRWAYEEFTQVKTLAINLI